MLKQLISQRQNLQEQADTKIAELEQFLTDNNIEEEILVLFRFQGSLSMKPIAPNVGKAKDTRYISFGWGLDKDDEWCLVCNDSQNYHRKMLRLSSAENYYKLAFVERIGVFLERMETWLFNSNDLVEKGMETLDTFIGEK